MASKNDITVDLSEGEMALVRRYAEQNDLSLEEAASEMVSRQLERRMRKKSRRSPASNVIKLRRS